jgi:hypothetical protein
MTSLPKTLQDVMGFPTIRMIHDGKVVSEYSGMRTKDGVLEYAFANIASLPKAKPALQEGSSLSRENWSDLAASNLNKVPLPKSTLAPARLPTKALLPNYEATNCKSVWL